MPVYVILLGIGVVLAAINQIAVILFPFFAPKGTVPTYIIHYYQDYFYYLDQVTQGTHGAWLTAEHFTSESLSKFILYWPHIYLGRMGGIIHADPAIIYNLAIAISVISFPFLIHAIAKHYGPEGWKHLSIVFLTLLTTGLMHQMPTPTGWVWVPFQIWRTPHPLFNRLGGVPSHLLQTILFYLTWEMIVRIRVGSPTYKQIAFLAVLSLLSSSVNPAMALVPLAAMGCAYIPWAVRTIRNPKAFLPVVLMFGVSLLMAYIPIAIYKPLLAELPHSIGIAWEATNQIHATPLELAASIGPILIPVAVGMIVALWSGSFGLLFAVATLFVGYGLFLSPIPGMLQISNTRFIFPGLYVAFAILAVTGLEWIGKKIAPKKYRSIVIIGTALIIAVGIPSAAWEFEMKISPVHELLNPQVYFSREIKEVLVAASKLPGDTVILTNPFTGLDTMAPAYTNHPSYSGHMLMTIDNPKKQQKAGMFYTLRMTEPEMRAFVTQGNISYIFISKIDGFPKKLESRYPILRPVITMPGGTVYEVMKNSK
jgi:hypothetical protein